MIKGIQKVHKPWVKPVAGLLAAGIVVYEAMLGQYIYIPIGLLVILACFFEKEHLVSREGVDIKSSLFRIPSHSVWTWDEIGSIHVDRRRAAPNVALHIKRGVAVRLFVFTPADARAVLDLARECNSAIQIEEMKK